MSIMQQFSIPYKCIYLKIFIRLQVLLQQSNFVDARYFKLIRKGDKMPENAVRPFERPLRFRNTTVNVAVAFWFAFFKFLR